MTFQRIVVGLLILTIAGVAGSFYMNWKTATQLRTVKAFVEGYVFAEAVAACEKAQSSTPFKWNTGTNTAVIGLTSVKRGVMWYGTAINDGKRCLWYYVPRFSLSIQEEEARIPNCFMNIEPPPGARRRIVNAVRSVSSHKAGGVA